MGAAVLLAWGAGLFWLVQRRGAIDAVGNAPERAAARPAPARVSPAAAYYGLSIGDSTVGFALLSLDTTLTTVDMVEQLDVRVPDGDSVRQLSQRTATSFDRRLHFSRVDVARRDGPARWTVTGRGAGDTAFVWARSGTDPSLGDTITIAGRALSSSAALPLVMLRGRPPRVGEVRTIMVADAAQRRLVPVEVTIAGDSVAIVPDSAAQDPVSRQWHAARWDTLRIWRLVRRGAGVPPLDTWVDEDGLPVLGDILPGVRAQRLPFEMATARYRSAAGARFMGLGGRIASRSATAPPRATPGDRLLLQNVLADSAGWARSALVGGAQQLRRDTLDVHRLVPDVSAVMPEINAIAGGPGDTLALLAARIVGQEQDPRLITERLVRWVRATVLPAPDFGPGDPLGALRRRRGGPSARAALLVELARRSGLEARPVAGLVAVSTGGWARHAWAEVRLGDWVPADPTFGTFPAGAGYVRLMQDVAADPLYLVPLAARLDPRRVPEKAQ